MIKENQSQVKNFSSMTGNDYFNAKEIKIELKGSRVLITDFFEKEADRQNELISHIQTLIGQLNDFYDFGPEVASEWVKYLKMVIIGYGKNLINPYSELSNYEIQTFSDKSENLHKIRTIKVLKELPDEALIRTILDYENIMEKTLFITAIGGADTTFYRGLSKKEIEQFTKDLYGHEVTEIFKKNNVIDFIPRALAAKKDKLGKYITNVESTILHAYNAGIRHVAVIANAKSYNPITEYLKKRLHHIKDLKIIVTVQPLLPIIKANNITKEILIASENGGYPGGHGHGFKYCLRNQNIQKLIESGNLEYFIFCNGDNAVVLNWGANHFAWTINEMHLLRQSHSYKNLRIAFFVVWEYLRKGGFTFLLAHKKSGNRMPQIFEAELASESGADIESLRKNRGGYSTNVATGSLKYVSEHLHKLPLALKKKEYDDFTNFVFEASLGTALTTYQNSDGTSVFDPNTAMNVIGPKTAKFQHWNHISTRKKDDFFSYFSSIFKTEKINTTYGEFLATVTRKTATQNYPVLKGNFVNPNIMNSKDFFEIFKDGYIDVEEFFGTIDINLLQETGIPRGRIKFEGKIKFLGEGEFSITVPAGEYWIIKDVIINTEIDPSINRNEIRKYSFDKYSKEYIQIENP